MIPRFKPSRVGIINIWDYVEQVFELADGRLVLRGPNGSGKTKALELLFPLVFDGRLDPRRLDPFSGDARTMKSNLLYGERKAAYGYAWMELSRPAEEGVERVTIGVGLSAKAERQNVKSWFFIAEGAVGEGVQLLDGERRPMTQRALTAQLGEGRVFDRAQDYRRAVDGRLFGLGEDRYEAMLELVLTLRRPQLAKDLDPDRLKEILNQGLRPVDEDLITQVAAAFDDLEAVQRDLEALERADAALQGFLTAHLTYLRTHARRRLDDFERRAAAVEEAAGEVERHRREEAEAGEEAEAARLKVLNLKEERTAREGEREGIQASEAFQQAGALKELERGVRAAERARREAESRHLSQAEEAAARRGDAEAAARAEHQAVAEVDRAAVAMGREALDAQVTWAAADAQGTPGELAAKVGAAVTARRAELAAVREALAASERAARQHREAEASLDRAEAAEEEARAAHRGAEAAAEAQREALVAGLAAWATAQPEGTILPGELPALEEAAEGLGAPGAPEPSAVLRERHAPRLEALSRSRAQLESREQTLRAEEAELVRRRDAIAAQTDDAPAPLPFRGASRDGRPGAPLWRLVDFAPGLGPREAAGVEAALEAAGILDAWLAPEGQPIPEGEDDAWLEPGPAVAGPSLADALVVEAEAAVPGDRVAALLASIPLGAGGLELPIAVAADGRFHLGPLRGALRREEASYIGATARAARRQRRLEELALSLARLRADLDALATELAEVDARRAALEHALASLPPTADLHRALALVGERRGALGQAVTHTRAQREVCAERARAAAEALRALREEARRCQVAPDAAGVAALGAAIDRLEEAGRRLVEAVSARGRAEAERIRCQASLSRAEEQLEQREAERQRAAEEHQGLHARHDTLKDLHGAQAQEIVARLAACEAELERLGVDLTAAEEGRLGAERRAAHASGALQQAGIRLEGAVEERRHAGERLKVFAEQDLADELGVEPFAETGGDAIVAFAARLAQAAGDAAATDERLKSTLTRVTRQIDELEPGLGAAYTPSFDFQDEIIRVTITDAEGGHAAGAFRRRLAARLEEQRLLLNDRERGLFEDQLLGTLCGQLHQRIQAARELVAAMDKAMRARRMSSGQTVGLSWRTHRDLPEDRKAALSLLEFDAAHLGPDQLTRLREHFAAEVQAARRAHPERAYLDLLAGVLDYRRWHDFVLSLIEVGGRSSELTRARYGKLSGGEKAVALHLPLFAAANAQYTGADPSCPRLIALDEAFAGIDEVGRPQLLALTVAFDLDLFLTGYDLWVADRAVPAMAHYDLYHDRQTGAVSTLRILWNGRALVEEDAGPGAAPGVA